MKTLLITFTVCIMIVTSFVLCVVAHEFITSRQWDWNVKQQQLQTCAMFNEIYKTMYYNADNKVEKDAIKNQWSQMKDICTNWDSKTVLDKLMKYDDSKFYTTVGVKDETGN
jgi:predicted enzyme involved in methoxymalonyl-ACP biosynthesis